MPDSDLVFASSGDPARARLTEVMYLGRLVVRLGLGERYGTSRNRKITTHSFRAYFITRVSGTTRTWQRCSRGSRVICCSTTA